MTGQGDVAGRLVETVQASLIDCHHGSNCRDTARDAHCWPADQTARAVLAAVLPLLADEGRFPEDSVIQKANATADHFGVDRNVAHIIVAQTQGAYNALLRDLAVRVAR